MPVTFAIELFPFSSRETLRRVTIRTPAEAVVQLPTFKIIDLSWSGAVPQSSNAAPHVSSAATTHPRPSAPCASPAAWPRLAAVARLSHGQFQYDAAELRRR